MLKITSTYRPDGYLICYINLHFVSNKGKTFISYRSPRSETSINKDEEDDTLVNIGVESKTYFSISNLFIKYVLIVARVYYMT